MVLDPPYIHDTRSSSSGSLAMSAAMAQGASAALCLCSSDAHDGNSHDAQKRAEHGTEYEYGGEHQQES
jgi:hypothetical protein